MRHEAVTIVVPAAAKLSRHRPTGGPVVEADVGAQQKSVYVGLPHIRIISRPGDHVAGTGSLTGLDGSGAQRRERRTERCQNVISWGTVTPPEGHICLVTAC